MDRNLDSQHNQPSSSHDTQRSRIERMERADAQRREYELVQRTFNLYRDRFEIIPNKLDTLNSEFAAYDPEAREHQRIANVTLHLYLRISPIGDFINAIITERNQRHHKAAGSIIDALPGRHGLVSDYLITRGLRPADFGEILSALDSNIPTKDVRELVYKSVGLQKVIATQKQVYTCMSNAITNLRQGLQELYQAHGNLNRVLRKTHDVYPIYSSQPTLGNPHLSSPEDIEIKLFPIHEVEGLENLVEMDNEVNPQRFQQIKNQNWQIFNNNRRLVTDKAYYTRYGLTKLLTDFK
jgi:hypothetical protein